MTEALPPDNDWDAVVLGAGPAGSMAALRLARRGARVLVVDKAAFPRPKVCGGCLGAVGLAALDESNVHLERLGVPSVELQRVAIHSGRRSATLPLGGRRAIDRAEFDERLLGEAARAGAAVCNGVSARVGEVERDRRIVRLQSANESERTVRCRLVLIAAGLGSHRLLPPTERPAVITSRTSRIGVGTTLAGEIGEGSGGAVMMLCGKEGYMGVAPLPGGRLDIAAAIGADELRGGLEMVTPIARSLFDAAGVEPLRGLASAEWRATPRLTQRPVRLGAERVLLLGDAAGYVEPFTGEGIGWALRSAIEVEPLAIAAIHSWREGLVDAWGRAHARAIGARQRRCRLVCGLIGARRVTPWVVRALSHAPWLGAPVMRSIDPVVSQAA